MSHATLYYGSAADAADVLECEEHSTNELSRLAAALINALRRIEVLEARVANLRRDLQE